MKRYFQMKVKHLFPGYFAMVMTAGVLSIGLYYLGMTQIARVLLVVNLVTYMVLVLLTLTRLVFYYPRIRRDMMSHDVGPGFFTLVAGTCVLGSQYFTVTGRFTFPLLLWLVGILLWIFIMYTFFTSITIRKRKPQLVDGINGAWLIAVVGTQSVSILGTLLSPSIGASKEVVLFFTLCMYFLGCMLYLNIITLIFYRFTFLKLQFEALTPPYWINMGAVAITTLAGSVLILHADQFSLLTEMTPFLKGFTLFFWVTGTWWIPLLFILMIWRHIVHRYPLTYDPQYWGMAFPLAMYMTSTLQLSRALNLTFLAGITYVMVYIAGLVYLLVLGGFFRHLYSDYRAFKYAKR